MHEKQDILNRAVQYTGESGFCNFLSIKSALR